MRARNMIEMREAQGICSKVYHLPATLSSAELGEIARVVDPINHPFVEMIRIYTAFLLVAKMCNCLTCVGLRIY